MPDPDPARTAPDLRPPRSRRWCIPPAIPYDTGESLEGAPVLRELEGDAALLLWSALRDVTLWASVPERRRAQLFTPAAAGRRLRMVAGARLDPAVELPLEILSGVLADPAGADPEGVALACVQVAEWAAARGAPGTAVAFSQAAANATPER
ncbi:MAG TPA: hypothetical protein VFX98_00570, partial [Longimicrobiaceae bacterium]|nr:hypothetical protein [Longimicrobiaceae bacterium]